MELLSSLITTNTPTLLSFCKYWLIKIIESVINLLLTYPINLIIFTSIILWVTYKISKRLFGNKQFKQTYKPLQHRDNLVDDMKLIKKQMRQMQSSILQIRKKISYNNNQFPGSQHQDQQQNNDENSQLNQATQIQNIFQNKVKDSRQTNLFNEQLQNQLKISMAEMLSTLKKVNTM